MRYKEDWEKTQVKFKEFWAMENHDRPLISVCAPKADLQPLQRKVPVRMADRWLDMDYVIPAMHDSLKATYFGGEAFPMQFPNLGPDIFGAILGCELEFGESTSWAIHWVEEWDEVKKFALDPDNKWWRKIKEMTSIMLEDAKDSYFVGITDLHAGIDGIVSLRGPENVCFDLLDDPEAIKRVNFELLEVFKQVLNELYSMTLPYQKGSSNWMGIWHPEKWYVTSCDFICMISQQMFYEFVLPELVEEINWLDASIFHLDGPGALKHLDALLSIPKLQGIQWVYGAGQPSASHWIPVLKKIQAAGKRLQVHIEPQELDVLMEHLKPEGVMFMTSCTSEQDARDLIRKAENAYKCKLF